MKESGVEKNKERKIEVENEGKCEMEVGKLRSLQLYVHQSSVVTCQTVKLPPISMFSRNMNTKAIHCPHKQNRGVKISMQYLYLQGDLCYGLKYNNKHLDCAHIAIRCMNAQISNASLCRLTTAATRASWFDNRILQYE